MNNLKFVEYSSVFLEEVRKTYNYYVEHTTISFDLEPYTPEQMTQLIMPLSSLYRTYVILANDAYAGYMLITQHKKKPAFNVTGEITIYLEPSCTGKGIGRPSLAFIEDVARELNFHSLIATICSENEGSVRMFTKLGYEKVSHYKEVGYKFERWLDIVVYQKILKNADRSW
ncbi:GNAT family N-acetyltransferase [Paenibacillus solisilvae]|uniref:GNAT family N-acetyltransferase n=1 Tax=Paenibacillus solisilvae TaxID=2486751 RepID=A0ABW0W9M0_9BACL